MINTSDSASMRFSETDEVIDGEKSRKIDDSEIGPPNLAISGI